MALTTIKIDDARAATNAIKARLDAQVEILGSYKTFIAQLQANWGGEGCKAFLSTFDKLSPKMQKMFQEMDGYNNQIIKLLEKMRETDSDAAKRFSGI